jgi:hypothetical protein
MNDFFSPSFPEIAMVFFLLRCNTKNLAAFTSRPLDFRYITVRRNPNVTELDNTKFLCNFSIIFNYINKILEIASSIKLLPI